MKVNILGDNALISATPEETEVIKEALICFFNSKPEKNLSQEESEQRKVDKKVAFRLHGEFPEPEIKYSTH